LAGIFDQIALQAKAKNAPFYGAVACAGIQQGQLAIAYDPVDFERILRVNVTGVFLTAKHSARILMQSKVKGSIVLVASMSGQIANRVSLNV
jgi:NAD(P)-dependent dehydrogenase (short-subunit alcohol dehydrogenase family)